MEVDVRMGLARKVKLFWGVLLVSIGATALFGRYSEVDELRQSSSEIVKGYAKELSSQDPKFEGTVRFGQALAKIEDIALADIPHLTFQDGNYWRAVLEMTPKDSSVLFAHAHLHAARGETAHADAYFLLGSLTAGKDHAQELDRYKRLRDGLIAWIAREIDRGVKLHDAGEYRRAIEVYDQVIAQYANAASAYYEKGLSYIMMNKSDPAMQHSAMAMYTECRKRDPFYWKAYQGNDPNVIKKLKVYLEKVHPFVSGKQRNKEGLIAFAEGCEAMELYPFAAHAQWKLALIDSDNLKVHLKKFLDLIEKCGCKDADFFRKQFKLNSDQ